MHKAGYCTPASAQGSLFEASAEAQAQGVTQIPEYAEQDWHSMLVHNLTDHM